MKSRWMLGHSRWMLCQYWEPWKTILPADMVGWWLVGWERFTGSVRDFGQNGGLESSPACPRHPTFFQRLRHSTFHDVTHNLQNCWSRTLNLSRDSGWHWHQHFWRCHFFGGMTMGDPLSLTLAALGGWTEILSSLIMLILLGTCYVAARESMIPGWIGIQPPSLETKIDELREHRKHGKLHALLQTREPVSWSFFSFSRSKTDSRKKMMHTGTVANLEDPWIAGRVWWVSTDVDPMFWRPEL